MENCADGRSRRQNGPSHTEGGTEQEAGVADYLEMSCRRVDGLMGVNQEAALPSLEVGGQGKHGGKRGQQMVVLQTGRRTYGNVAHYGFNGFHVEKHLILQDFRPHLPV